MASALPRISRAKIVQAIPGATPELVRALEQLLTSVAESIPELIDQALQDANSAGTAAASAQATADNALALATTAVQGANGPDGRVQVAQGGTFASFSALTYSDTTQRLTVGGVAVGRNGVASAVVDFPTGSLRLGANGAWLDLDGASGCTLRLASPGMGNAPFRVETMFGTVFETGDNDSDQKIVGFYGVTPVTRPNVTGSRGGNAALQSLLSALASLGLVTDSSTA